MKKALSFMFIFFLAVCSYAQSAEVVSEILDAEQVTVGQICYLSAVHQNLIKEDASYEEAVDVLQAVGQKSFSAEADSPIKMKELSEIFLQMWPEVDGGLMYRITKGSPRYAFKRLKADGILPERADPSRTLKGWDALNILTSCMMEYGSSEECMEMSWEE